MRVQETSPLTDLPAKGYSNVLWSPEGHLGIFDAYLMRPTSLSSPQHLNKLLKIFI